MHQTTFQQRQQMYCPWGPIDSTDEIAEGITFISTARHGGFMLSPERMAMVPNFVREHNFLGSKKFFEEDCDANIVIVLFPDCFAEDSVVQAKSRLERWNPELFELLMDHGK